MWLQSQIATLLYLVVGFHANLMGSFLICLIGNTIERYKMKLVDYTPEILVTIVIISFLFGVGYLITIDIANNQDIATQCIAAGMEYIRGDCMK
jgi:hypothetical protein